MRKYVLSLWAIYFHVQCDVNMISQKKKVHKLRIKTRQKKKKKINANREKKNGVNITSGVVCMFLYI